MLLFRPRVGIHQAFDRRAASRPILADRFIPENPPPRTIPARRPDGVSRQEDGVGITIPSSRSSHPIAVNRDPTRLERIVLNLINNAAKYTEPGGRIGVELRQQGREVALRNPR